jgi:hypothetical protein
MDEKLEKMKQLVISELRNLLEYPETTNETIIHNAEIKNQLILNAIVKILQIK